ncbi:hypothetical protein BDZ94DRAFT_252431 [Collybia nuda]|uniref:Uncharacterized protein n=1 Tax=Collybia nuda TaxID=64659 RepID=A0A9P6CMR0_9AGAR|nr:hypothetical protein BDZ94DRAFT_252431 [Collybia nuda]
MTRTLPRLRARRRGLTLGSLLSDAIRRYVLQDKNLTHPIPMWALFCFLRTLRKSEENNSHKLSSISPIDRAEQLLLGEPPGALAQTPAICRPPPALLHEVFLARVRLSPLAIACCSYRTSAGSPTINEIAYASSHAAALQLADKLGVLAQSVVPIALSDPVDIAISMVAVLLAGVTCVLVDPAAIDAHVLQHYLDLGQP